MTVGKPTGPDLPTKQTQLRFPETSAARLQHLLDKQDAGRSLTTEEQQEAIELVELAERVTLLRLQAERARA